MSSLSAFAAPWSPRRHENTKNKMVWLRAFVTSWLSSECGPHHDFPNQTRRRPMRRVIRLHRLPFRVAGEPMVLPGFRRTDGIEVRPEVGRDGVVGEVGDHPCLLAVLDFPERVAAELAVVALLVDAEAAGAVHQHAVLDVRDHLVDRRRSLGTRLELDVRHPQEGVVAPVVRERAAAALLLADEVR